jgi:hypothetical protein
VKPMPALIRPETRAYFEDRELSRHIKERDRILTLGRGYDLTAMTAMTAAKRKRERRFVTVPPAIRRDPES